MATVKKDEAVAEKPTLRLQSKYRNHTVQIKPTRRVFHAELGMVEAIPGVFAKFEGPQRIFDSARSAEVYEWDDITRDLVERKLVTADGFMSDYYPAPLSQLPEHLMDIARVKPKAKRLTCQAFGFVDGDLKQCPKDATAGRQFCDEHDPDVTRISRTGTTVG